MGDELVGRLREGICVAPSMTGDGSHLDIQATERLLAEAADRIEALMQACAHEIRDLGEFAAERKGKE